MKISIELYPDDIILDRKDTPLENLSVVDFKIEWHLVEKADRITFHTDNGLIKILKSKTRL